MTRPKGILNYSSQLESTQRLCYARHRAQAKHRGEPYTLTFEDFKAIWGEQFEQRGKAVEALCMSRRDKALGWTPTNTIIVTRQQHLSKAVELMKKPRKGVDEWEIPDEIKHRL